jgi:hypothetical protein
MTNRRHRDPEPMAGAAVIICQGNFVRDEPRNGRRAPSVVRVATDAIKTNGARPASADRSNWHTEGEPVKRSPPGEVVEIGESC